MEKKQFKAESQRLLDLMINSIYTHKEIFLREIISNASDAIDKLAYRALTDEKVGLNRERFQDCRWSADKEARTLTVADNGIGMTKEELENNLGTIANSGSLQFKKETENDDDADTGHHRPVRRGLLFRLYGGGQGDCDLQGLWRGDRLEVGVRGGGRLHHRALPEGHRGHRRDHVTSRLTPRKKITTSIWRPIRFRNLIKKYSDYIRYPIRMEMDTTVKSPSRRTPGKITSRSMSR